MAEWGFVSLPELEALHVPAEYDGHRVLRMPVIVERDLAWRPVKVAEADLPGFSA
jgi:hypothetical protein